MTAGPAESDSVICNPLRASGLVDVAALDRARAWQHEHGGLLSDALLRLKLVSEGDFLRIFAELYSTRFVKSDKLRALKLDERLLDKVGVRRAERLRMCPIRWDEGNAELHVVAAVPVSSNLEPEVRQALGARVITVYVATVGAVGALIRRSFYGEDDAFTSVTENGAGPPVARPRPEEDGFHEPTLPSATRRGDTRAPTHPSKAGLAETVEGGDDEPREPTISSKARVAEEVHEPTISSKARLYDEEVHEPTSSQARSRDEHRVPTVSSKVIVPDELGAEQEESREKTVMVRYNDEATTIATLRRENARYRIAQEFHRRVGLERTVEAMVDRILTGIFELLPAEGVAIWLTSGQFASKVKSGQKKLEVPRAVIDQALASTAGLLTHNALMDERFDRSKSVMVRGVQSVMAVPMRTPRSGVIGVLYVESVSQSAAFTEEDLPLLESIGAQASILLDNAALLAQVRREVENRTNLSRFLSSAAVEEVLSGRMNLRMDGATADVTVLFADIRGFTTLSSQMPAEDVVHFLNRFFSETVDAVERHGGIVDKFIGDAVMAIWGAPIAREDDARNALNAAVEMAERATRVSVFGQPLQLGVGVNSGPAVVGAIGSRKRLDYTAIGATVNLAARLCGIADGGQVLITSDTLMRAGPGVLTEAGEPVILKGLETPIVPYSVKGVTQPLRLSQPARHQVPTTPVGRPPRR